MRLVLRTGVAAALLAGALAAVGCAPPPVCACAPPVLPRLTYAMTINGRPVSFPRDGVPPSYRMHPGEHLTITLAVTVPRRLRLTTLWLGISTGTWGTAAHGRPVGMHPVLAHYSQPLPAGVHRFGLRWRIPEHSSRTSFFLMYAWSSRQPSASAAGPVAKLTLS